MSPRESIEISKEVLHAFSWAFSLSCKFDLHIVHHMDTNTLNLLYVRHKKVTLRK